MKLTKTFIDQTTKTGIYWDDLAPGLGVRVTKGAKTFVFRYRYKGRQKMPKLARYGEITLHQARDIAKIKALELANRQDPFATEQTSRPFREVFETYIQVYAKPRKRSWEKDRDLIENHVLPRIGAKTTIMELDQVRITKIHDDVSKKTPIAANRMLSCLSKIFSFSKSRGYHPGPNPCKGIERNTETKRERYVTPDEMPRLAQSLREETNPCVTALIWLYILTALRKSELRFLKWGEVGIIGGRQVLNIPAERTKNKKPHTVPLSPLGVAMLRQLPIRGPEDFVFVGYNWDKPIDIDSAWQRVRKRAKLEDITLHGLRHTAVSWLVQDGVSLALAGQVANHSSPSVTQGYSHRALEPLEKALDSHSERLSGYIDVTPHESIDAT